MLIGTYKYAGYLYRLRGYDFDDNVVFKITPHDSKARLFMDAGITIGEDRDYPKWDDIYVSIGSGNVQVECGFEEVGGVKYKSELNPAPFERLGSIIRGMKATCNRDHRSDEDEIYDGSAMLNRSIRYVFDSGYMLLDMKTVLSMQYSNEDGTELELEEDGTFSEKLFKPKLLKKYKLDLSEFIKPVVEDDSWSFADDDTIFSLSDIIEKNPDKNYLWLKERKYYIVKNINDVRAICQKIWKHDGIVAFDTETTGLNVNVTSRTGNGDRLVGMVFSITPGVAWYFPIAHKKVQNICTEGTEHYIIEKYFKPILEKKELLCHNGSYDWKVMHNYGICCNITQDTLILFKVTLWNDNRSMSLGLKPLTHDFLNRDSFELSDFVKGKFGSNNVKFWDLEEESVKYYACPDTDNLLELWQWAMDNKLLEKYGAKKIYQIEVAFSIVIAYQEYYGHCVDISKIDALVAKIKEDKEREYAEMVKIAGRDFNPNSAPDLKNIVFDTLKYPVIELTDTGAPSCGKNARKAWCAEKNPDGSPKYPFAQHLNDWKTAQQLESNFTKNIDKFATEDGLMFSEVQQFLETGRVSVKNPNYQSYNDTVKKYIIPRTGYYALDADYSSVEARIMVSMAGCKDMIEKLKDPDTDYHTAKASDMFGVPYELVSKKLRKMSKGVNFGILYGLGDWNLAINLGREGSRENALWAHKQKELYFKGMEELKSFIDISKRQGTEHHYSETFYGRRRYYDPRKTPIDRIERQSCNARIQGTAADIYKFAMVRLFHAIRKHGLVGKIYISAFVHDECFLEVHKSLDPCKVLKILRECMMIPNEGWCPLFIGAGFGHNWYEAKKTEIPIQVQEIMINNWGTTGLDWWNGDTDMLYQWEVDTINDYKRDRIIAYVKNPENHDKVLNPAVNALTYEIMEDIFEGGVKVEGVVDSNCHVDKDDMIANLGEFCKAFGVYEDFERANIKKPEHKEATINNIDESEIKQMTAHDISPKEVTLMRINTIGVHSTRDGSGKKIYFRYDENDPVLLRLSHKIITDNPGDAEVIAVKDGEFYGTGLYMAVKAFPKLLQLYLQRANM
jgi:DNA polymerase-1